MQLGVAGEEGEDPHPEGKSEWGQFPTFQIMEWRLEKGCDLLEARMAPVVSFHTKYRISD
jgi:hypothetical protein